MRENDKTLSRDESVAFILAAQRLSMKRKIGLAVCIATLGVISIQCSSEDPADDDGTAGAPPVIGGGGNTASAGQPGAGKANVAGGGMTSVAGGGSGGAAAGAPGTAGKPGGGAGPGGSPSGGNASGGASAGTSAGGVSGGIGGSPSAGSAGVSGGVGGASGGASGGVAGSKAGSGGSGGGSAGGGGTARTFAEVQSIINMRCATGGCHSGAPNMHTNFKANLYQTLTTPLPDTTDCGGTTLVDKANPSMSFLVQVVKGKATCSPKGQEIDRMPFAPSMPLSAGDIDTIESWITAGAPM